MEYSKRWVGLAGLFLLGVAVSQAAFLFLSKQSPQGPKPVEITQEATSSSATAKNAPRLSFPEEVVITRVIDGDTVELTDGRKLRYIGIDTPELVHPDKAVECGSRQAMEENKRLVEGKTVRLEKDVSETDKYGRLLRYVWVGEVMVNDWLVRQGFAHVSTYPPDVKYQEQLRQAEREARENNRGLWSGCPLPTP